MLNPLAAGGWNYDAAAHLALRASFGEPPAELEKWVNQGLDSTLEYLLHTPPPSGSISRRAKKSTRTRTLRAN
jgi:hypothetical protein